MHPQLADPIDKVGRLAGLFFEEKSLRASSFARGSDVASAVLPELESFEAGWKPALPSAPELIPLAFALLPALAESEACAAVPPTFLLLALEAALFAGSELVESAKQGVTNDKNVSASTVGSIGAQFEPPSEW